MPLLESVCAATECADPILALALKILSVEGSKSLLLKELCVRENARFLPLFSVHTSLLLKELSPL
jgi:hypothetical protein